MEFISIKSKKKEGFFLKNGGRMLEQIITSFNGKCNPIRIFSEKELKKATNNYHEDGILQKDLDYNMYKGTLEDRAISVKTFTVSSYRVLFEDPVELFTNEIAVASHMSNHKNVLKLIGCCLETKIPTLVYEFAANGNLSDHIFGNLQALPWDSMLRIAKEIANAAAYLHHSTPKVIIHRDIQSTNILLDQDNVAKLFNFQKSKPIPLGKKDVIEKSLSFEFTAEELEGKCIAPESLSSSYRYKPTLSHIIDYFYTGPSIIRFTEKSDVYSVGAVLTEILTGKRASKLLLRHVDDVPKDNTLTSNSLSSQELKTGSCSSCTDCNMNKVDRHNEFSLKANILELKDGNRKQLMECGELALRCVKMNPDERPTMMEVAQALRSIQRLQDTSV